MKKSSIQQISGVSRETALASPSPKPERYRSSLAALREAVAFPQQFLGLLILTAIENSLITGAFWAGMPISFEFVGSVYALCSAAGLMAAAVLFRKRALWAVDASFYRRFAIAFSASLAALVGVGFLPVDAASILAVLAMGVGALCYAPLVLSWVSLFARLPIATTFVCFSLAYAGGCAVSLVAVLLEPKWLVELLIAVSAFVTWSFFKTSLAKIQKEGEAPLADSMGAAAAEAPFPLRPVVICGVVAFLTTFLQNCGVSSDVPLANWIGAVLTAALLGWFIVRGRTNLMGLQQVVLVLAVAAALSIPFAGSAVGNGGTACAMAANLLFLVFAETVLCGIALRYGLNASWLVGVSLAVMAGSSFVAVLAAHEFQLWPAGLSDVALFSAVLALAVLVLFLRFVTESDVLGAWGMEPAVASDGDAAAPFGDVQLSMRVFALSCRYGFTKREEEVCALLAQGVNVAGIEEALVVSNSTAKSHVAHIYKKMGIHSIQEFRELFACS